MSVALLLWAGVASAFPVDAYLDVTVGTPVLQRVGKLAWVETDDPKIATVELLPAGEIQVEGKAPGRTLIMAYTEGGFVVWRARVSAKGKPVPVEHAEPGLLAAHARCKSLQEVKPGSTPDDPESQTRLRVTVPDELCREALHTLFLSDDYVGKDAEVTFELTTLQSQLGALDQALRAAGLSELSVRYLGAGLELHGTTSEPKHRRALFELFKTAVGRVALDDEVETPPAPLPL